MKATPSDLLKIYRFAQKFHGVSPYGAFANIKRECLMRVISKSIEQGCAFVHEHGVIVGLLTPLYFNDEVQVLQEVFWWAEKDGLKLLEEFEAKAVEEDCLAIQMAALTAMSADRVEKIYFRRGYTKMESYYIKEL